MTFLRDLLDERLTLFAGQELKQPGDRGQEHVGLSAVEVGSRQEIRADHLQTIAAGFVRTQHQGCRLNRLLNHRNLAPVELEVDDLGRFGVLAGEVLIDFALELVPG